MRLSNLQQRKRYEEKSQQNFFSSNQDAFGFGQSMVTQMKYFCQPLREFGITMFTYSRILKTGERLYLSSNQEWFTHYVKNDFQDDIDHLEHYVPADGIKTALWNGFKMDRVFSAAYDQFDLWHGFSIYEKQSDHVDFFDFATHKDNHQMVQFYFNNLGLLEEFVQGFKEVAFKWATSAKQTQLLVPKNRISFDEIQRESPITPDYLEGFLQKDTVKFRHKSYKNRPDLQNIIEKNWDLIRFNAINFNAIN